MNIYHNLNEMLIYIDNNLDQDLDDVHLAHFLGVNNYTMRRLFSLLTNMSLSEYIRKRRLSQAGFDLLQDKYKVIDLAIKYQYESATSFSRAFEKFHGIKPSQVNERVKLNNFPRIVFDEKSFDLCDFPYEIIDLDEMILYGKSISTSIASIKSDAPNFFKNMLKKYEDKYGLVDYGMIVYDDERAECKKYYCLYKKEIKDFEQVKIPKAKWIRFRIQSQSAKQIQEVSQRFYKEFLPSSQFSLREMPELEYYHDGITDFLVAIN